MFEIFDPRIGTPIYTTHYEWVAKLLAWWHGLDYAAPHEGWIYPESWSPYEGWPE